MVTKKVGKVSTAAPRPTNGRLNRLHEGTRVKKMMGSWHPIFDPKKHRGKYLHGTCVKTTGYRSWIVWWDDGYNWNENEYTADTYNSSSLIVEEDDVHGPYSNADDKDNDKLEDEDIVSESDDEDIVPTNTSTKIASSTKPHARFVHYVTPTKDSPAKLFKLDTNKIETFSKLPPSDSGTTLTGNLLTFDSTNLSDSSQHTYHPSPETLINSDLKNCPNDADATEVSKLNKIIPHCTEESELKRWKEKVRKLQGTEVKIVYDKRKGLNIVWTIEDFVGNRNIHEDKHQYLPVFESTKMPTSQVNPMKNFIEVFPEHEMRKCVQAFNDDMLDESTKSWFKSTQNNKYWRNKNNSYFKELTVDEFKIFLGLLMAGTTRVESGINLWKEKRTRVHYFNSAPDFGKWMSHTRFTKIRKHFSKCFCDTGKKHTDPWWNIIGGVEQFNRIRRELFTRVPVVVLDESMCAWHPRTTK